MRNPAQKIVQYTKMIHRNGWNSVYDGNISYRPRLCGHFYITESSIRKYNITKKNVLHIPTNLNFDSVDERIKKSYSMVSREILFHQFIMRNVPGVEDCVIIHCHPKNCVAYMGIGFRLRKEMNTLKTYFPELNLNIAKNVPYVEAGTKQLATYIEHSLFKHDENKRFDIIGMENHGIISIGSNFRDAYDNISQLEYYCTIYNSAR